MKAVLRQTGLSADRLRIWEKRYGAVKPARSPSGRRVYREADVHRLKLLAALVRQGHLIGKVAHLSDAELFELTGEVAAPGAERVDDLKEFMAGLDRFDLPRMRVILGRLRYSTSPQDFVFRIVPEIMFQVSKKYAEGRVSIAQEHATSEILNGHLKRIYEDLQWHDGVRASEGAFLFCTRDGDPHDFGLMMAAIACRAFGLKTEYVGRSLPVEALSQAVAKLQPRAIVLGLSTIAASEERIAPQAYLDAIDAALPAGIEIWAGGSALPQVRKPRSRRPVFFFENVDELESKIRVLAPSAARESAEA